MGIDGAIGLPAYAGAYPNTMLAHALVLNRDLQLAGRATEVLTSPPDDLSKWDHLARPDQNEAIRRQQVNVRAGNADAEVNGAVTVKMATGSFGATAKLQTNWVDQSDKPVNLDLVTITLPGDKEYGRLLSRQTSRVLSYADLRSERVNEILAQVVPQVAFWSAIAGLQPDRHKYTLELLGVGLRFATQVVQRFKLQLNVQRPMEVSPMVQPIVLTPGHTAFPSGHATEASFAAELLTALRTSKADGSTFGLPDSLASNGLGTPNHAASLRTQLHRLAYRVAENRVVAGVHYPMDSVAGQVLGITLAHFFLWLATKGQFTLYLGAALDLSVGGQSASLDIEPSLDKPFCPANVAANSLKEPKPSKGVKPAAEQQPVLNWLWEQAIKEA